MNCPCGTDKNYEACCGPFISGEQYPLTAEALMRSRYTAYTKVDVDYIQKTTFLKSKSDFDRAATKKWASEAQWQGLKILNTELGSEKDKKGVVEFVATYTLNDETIEHHEVSQFRRDPKDHWIFFDGEAHTHKGGEGHQHHHPKIETVKRDSVKVGRNDPCPCGSGKKYKKCCGR